MLPAVAWLTGDGGVVELGRAGGAGELVLRAARERDRERESGK